MRHLFIVLGVTLLLVRCGNKDTIYFEKPQPENVRDLSKIPSSYVGEYVGKDSTRLIIGNSIIIQKYTKIWPISKTGIDTSEVTFINEGLIVDKETKEKYRIKTSNDSIYVYENKVDTLFLLSNENIARRFKHTLILNKRHSDNLWSVEIYKLQKGILSIMFVESKSVFDKLSSEIENKVVRDSTKADTLKMILKPTKRQFKRILKIEESMVKGEYRKVK